MLNKIIRWFTPEQGDPSEVQPLPAREPEPESEPEPSPPPTVIEVPWKFAAGPKNLEDAINKIYAELKEFIYDAKIKEIHAFKTVDKFTDLKKQKIEQLKQAYGIPDDLEYEFILPEGTGRPGYLKKKESK